MSLDLMCNVCKTTALYKCSACKRVAYCNKEHQKSDWKFHKQQCRPFQVATTDELGRHLLASREIVAGECLLTEGPIVCGPRLVPTPGPQCVGCFSPQTPASCPSCHWPACSPNCPALTDPFYHLQECILFTRCPEIASQHNFNFEAILPLRCLILQKKHPSKFEQLMSLQSHIEMRGPSTEIYKEIDDRVVRYLLDNVFSKLEEKVFENLSEQLIHKICGILEVNALEINTENCGEALSIYPMMSLLEHSCLPNTRYIFQSKNFKIKVFAAKNISKEEHISTMYSHMLWSTLLRREHLILNKYFKCGCVRCSDPTELGTELSTLRCISSNVSDVSVCAGEVRAILPLDDKTDWKCNKCPLMLTSDQVADLCTRLQEQVDLAMQEPDVLKLETLLGNLEKLLHPHHYHCYTVKHSLIQLYGREEGFKHTQLSMERLNRKIEICRDLLEVTTRIDPGHGRLPLYTAVLGYELHSALIELRNRQENKDLQNSFLGEARQSLDTCLRALVSENTVPARELHSLASRDYEYVNSLLCSTTERSHDID